MRPPEVRALIIDDEELKRRDLTALVEAGGGQVVGMVDDRAAAHETINDPGFPASAGNPNVVLIDGTLRKRGAGSDGMYVFYDGFLRAVLHGADTAEGIGAVAIGCSDNPRSETALALGANITRLDQKDASERWAALLEPHPAEPTYLRDGVMERGIWRGATFETMIGKLLGVEEPGKSGKDITLCALSVVETENYGWGDIVVTHSGGAEVASDVALGSFVADARTWHGVDMQGSIVADERVAKAVIRVRNFVYVIHHSSKVVDRLFDDVDLYESGLTDKIAVDTLAEIPDSYWECLGLEKPNDLLLRLSTNERLAMTNYGLDPNSADDVNHWTATAPASP